MRDQVITQRSPCSHFAEMLFPIHSEGLSSNSQEPLLASGAVLITSAGLSRAAPLL